MHRTVWVLLLCAIPGNSFAHAHRKAQHAIDPFYSSALAAANRFLHAWQSEDHETGIVMLTDSAREHLSAEKLQEFFSPGQGAAYEILRGRRVSPRIYAFPVVLFSSSGSNAHPRICTVLVTRDGKQNWAVDKLP